MLNKWQSTVAKLTWIELFGAFMELSEVNAHNNLKSHTKLQTHKKYSEIVYMIGDKQNSRIVNYIYEWKWQNWIGMEVRVHTAHDS